MNSTIDGWDDFEWYQFDMGNALPISNGVLFADKVDLFHIFENHNPDVMPPEYSVFLGSWRFGGIDGVLRWQNDDRSICVYFNEILDIFSINTTPSIEGLYPWAIGYIKIASEKKHKKGVLCFVKGNKQNIHFIPDSSNSDAIKVGPMFKEGSLCFASIPD